MSKPRITLYIDILSPFAYYGFYALQNFTIFKQCNVTYVPIYLRDLVVQCGGKTPLSIKNKDKWIRSERLRWSRHLNIPTSPNLPPGFPTNTFSIQCTLTALSLSHPQSLIPAISLFYHNYWVKYNEPEKPENLLAIVKTVLGCEKEARKATKSADSEEAKEKLKANTEKAFADGAFGLPWFVATNLKGETEGFWGVDHLGQLCDHLGLERPDDKGFKTML
ncbi:thioredoxin-like protein [Lojkania enalia]|uniref:Glutathione S-transferase kappa n=1 Tax=Lojkania enalia TaxID=147567 RepID=A0A9P4KHP1_9PLEO|nr:thioredoxin-like protein [Didymosphaeria enalia]